MEFDEIFTELVKRSRPSLVSAAPVSLSLLLSLLISKYDISRQTEGVGTVPSHYYHTYNDDGGLSSDDGNSDDEADEVDVQEVGPPPSKPTNIPGKPPQLAINPIPISPATPTPGNLPTPTPIIVEPTPKASAGFSVPTSHFIPKMKFGKKLGLSSSPASPALPSPGIDVQGVLVPPPTRGKFVRNWSSGSLSSSAVGSGNENSNSNSSSTNLKSVFKFEGGNDIVGIVMLEIQSASDLPRLPNSTLSTTSPRFIYLLTNDIYSLVTRTGWDMDPFVVISFGKKVFRTRVIRHSRNPIWDEKLLFHVRRYETAFQVQLTVLDWDKLSSNDHIGDASFNVKDLVRSAPQRDPVTGLYSEADDGDHPMTEYKLPLKMPWKLTHDPVITFRYVFLKRL